MSRGLSDHDHHPHQQSTVYLVSCVGKKRTSPAPAKDLYMSDWFLKVRRYVEATGCPWFILSAKYGLVAPDQVLVPYEQTLNTMGVSQRRAWARAVQTQMDQVLPQLPQSPHAGQAKHVVMFAGQRYREFLMALFRQRGISVDVPLEGLRIGEQLSWLVQNSGDR